MWSTSSHIGDNELRPHRRHHGVDELPHCRTHPGAYRCKRPFQDLPQKLSRGAALQVHSPGKAYPEGGVHSTSAISFREDFSTRKAHEATVRRINLILRIKDQAPHCGLHQHLRVPRHHVQRACRRLRRAALWA